MSEFSPLRDPVFLLTWQVHLAVVTLFVLLGIWAGMTRRRWYVAPTLFLGLLWLFVPLEAPEPAVVLLLTVPVLAVLCRVARRWLEKPREESSVDSQSHLRFSLVDLLWLTLIVGMTTALVMQLWRLPWKADWRDLIFFDACMISLSMLVLIAVSSRAWTRPLLTSAILFALLVAAWFAGVPLVEKNWLLLIDWDVLPLPTKSRQHLEWAYGLTIAEFLLFTASGVALISPSAGQLGSRRPIVFKRAVTGLFGAVSIGLAIIYFRMLDRPQPPIEQWPEINEREAFWAVLERHRQLNRQYRTQDELPASKGPAAALAVSEILAELDGLLQRGNISQFDSRFDRPDHETNLISVQAARSMARALTAQAKADWPAGRRNEALTHDFRCLRLGQALQRRGIMVDSLVGMALEGMALSCLAQIRTELTVAENHQVSGILKELAETREPLDLLLARERFFEDRAGGWRGRLFIVGGQLLGIEKFPQTAARTFHRRDAILSLVRADLAIRCYRQMHGAWPKDLAALTPDLLPSAPMDPFSGKPLVYRAAEDGFTLYSTATDGVDDGGKFGDMGEYRLAGYDLDLEMWLGEWWRG
jgi:hypothetical protein